jgi:hypothetical protein
MKCCLGNIIIVISTDIKPNTYIYKYKKQITQCFFKKSHLSGTPKNTKSGDPKLYVYIPKLYVIYSLE